MTNARSSGSLHRQVRRMLVQCITIVLLLAMSVCLGIELHQEVRTRDQLLSNAAQMAADAPLLTDDIQADGVQQYLARTVQHVSEVDMLGVYDMEMLAYIRSIVAEKYGNEAAEETSILYGGSCKASNACEPWSRSSFHGRARPCRSIFSS